MLPQIGGHRRSRGARFDLQDAEDLGSEEKGPAGRRPLLPVISNKKAFGAATARDRADSPKARDFFALAHRARNPHESDFHMQARLGFTRTRQSSIRLRPLATGRSSNVQSGDEYAGDVVPEEPRQPSSLLRRHRRVREERAAQATMEYHGSRPCTVWAPEDSQRPPSGTVPASRPTSAEEAVDSVAHEAVASVVAIAAMLPMDLV